MRTSRKSYCASSVARVTPGPTQRLLWVVLAVAAVGGLAWGAPPSEREARAWLALPKSSTSLGRTNDGALIEAVALPPKGAGYVVLAHALGRKTNFGTAEMIGMIERATRRVREAYPGSVLGIGNIGFEDGRKIPWSVSHQAGRDADLGMYATTLDGRAVRAPAFHRFDASGLAAGPGGAKRRFDVGRNLALVLALSSDGEARVQYVFVAAWLRDKLLAEAGRIGVPPATIARLQELLHQPSDSNPHADHFHVRLFCTIEDRLAGCSNWGPPRAWVDPGDREHAEAARRIASILAMTGKNSSALQVKALERLEAMAAVSELDAITRALAVPDKKVRRAALEAAIGIGDARAADGIVRILREVADPAWATQLFAAIPKLDAGALVPLAERVLASGGVEGLLHPSAVKGAQARVRVAALEVLRDHGSERHVPLLLTLADDKEPAVKRGALSALAHRTCQSLKNANGYRAWFGKARGESALAWIEAGLRAHKVSLPAGVRSKDGVGRLVGLLDHTDAAVRMCAWRALVALTGHDEDWRLRPPTRNRKHWQSWWSENAAMVELP